MTSAFGLGARSMLGSAAALPEVVVPALAQRAPDGAVLLAVAIALVWALAAYGPQGFWDAIVLRQTVGLVEQPRQILGQSHVAGGVLQLGQAVARLFWGWGVRSYSGASA